MQRQTDFYNFASQYITTLATTLSRLSCTCQDASSPISRALSILETARDGGRAVWLIGNGGAASLAAHMATDLQLAGLRAQALTDVAAITTIGNDDSFNDVFTTQLNTLAAPEDVLIAISTSGKSPNILQAMIAATGIGMKVIALLGTEPPLNHMNTYCDVGIPLVLWNGNAPGRTFQHKQRWHTGAQQDYAEVVLHLLAYWLMQTERREHAQRIVEMPSLWDATTGYASAVQ